MGNQSDKPWLLQNYSIGRADMKQGPHFFVIEVPAEIAEPRVEATFCWRLSGDDLLLQRTEPRDDDSTAATPWPQRLYRLNCLSTGKFAIAIPAEVAEPLWSGKTAFRWRALGPDLLLERREETAASEVVVTANSEPAVEPRMRRQRRIGRKKKTQHLPIGLMALEYVAFDSLGTIAERWGTAPATVASLLRERGITIRSQGKSNMEITIPIPTRIGIVPRRPERQHAESQGRYYGPIAGPTWLDRHPELEGYFGSEVPFAHLSETEIELLEAWMRKHRKIDFIMTHDSDGLSPALARPRGQWGPLPMVHTSSARVMQRWEGMEPSPYEILERTGKCRVSYDGGISWTPFTPGPSKRRKGRPVVKRKLVPWQNEVAWDLRSSGLLPRFHDR